MERIETLIPLQRGQLPSHALLEAAFGKIGHHVSRPCTRTVIRMRAALASRGQSGHGLKPQSLTVPAHPRHAMSMLLPTQAFVPPVFTCHLPHQALACLFLAKARAQMDKDLEP